MAFAKMSRPKYTSATTTVHQPVNTEGGTR